MYEREKHMGLSDIFSVKKIKQENETLRKVKNTTKDIILLLCGTVMTIVSLGSLFILFTAFLLFADFQQEGIVSFVAYLIIIVIFLALSVAFGWVAFICFKSASRSGETAPNPKPVNFSTEEASVQPVTKTPPQPITEEISKHEAIPAAPIAEVNAETNISYIEAGNVIYRTDGQSITDEEIPYLMQVGYEKALEKEKATPKRTMREEDLCTNFMMNHSSDIELHVDKFEELYRKAYSEQNLDLKIELLKQTILEYNKAKKWFYRTKGGTIYFEDMYEHLHNSRNNSSYIDPVQGYLDYCIDKRDVVIPQILSAIGDDGIIQKDIYELVDSDKSDIQKTIRELESENRISREKKGNSYLLTLK